MARTDRTSLWVVVALISLALLAGLVALWRAFDCCALGDIDPLQSEAEVQDVLTKAGSDGLFQLPTGIYVQSLSFASANDVQMTGRIWQRLPPGQTLPEGAKMGVLFADAISAHSGNLARLDDDYVLPNGARLYMWDFQVVLRQDFNYDHYPLDGKLVWVRLWTDDLENKVQLVPDLGAYGSTETGARLGISRALVPGEWSVLDSFFGLHRVSYDTDFGRDTGGPFGQPMRPELRFHIVLERNFSDAFLVNLVPLFVTLGLLFGLTMTVSRDPDTAGRLGFSTLSVFGSCAGLFFISLLGHIQIRQQFAGSQIVYLEYFYILSYVVLLFVSVFSFMITYTEKPHENWLLRNDGQNAKLFYWPVILAAILALSVWKLHLGLGGIAEG